MQWKVQAPGDASRWLETGAINAHSYLYFLAGDWPLGRHYVGAAFGYLPTYCTVDSESYTGPGVYSAMDGILPNKCIEDCPVTVYAFGCRFPETAPPPPATLWEAHLRHRQGLSCAFPSQLHSVNSCTF